MNIVIHTNRLHVDQFWKVGGDKNENDKWKMFQFWRRYINLKHSKYINYRNTQFCNTTKQIQ